jgi:hypothetical protein
MFYWLAISDRASMLSLAGQIGAMVLAVIIGRFALKRRSAIWIVSFLGAMGAMVANILVDGQGAFLMLIYAPLIYLFAVAGRDLR